MIYTSNSQVAAILPSNTPVGIASLTVTYNGITTQFSTAQAMVAVNSVGLYTTSSSGLGVGSFTALDGTLKTFAGSAKTGETVYLWATGLGPISTPDNVLPTSFPNFPGVQVWIGGQAAPIVYDGRSGCCSGVDQLAVTIPNGIAGCSVPVTVTSGGSTSNTVTLSVTASGGPCTDSGPTLPTSILTRAAAGQAVNLGIVAVGSANVLGPGSNVRAVAERLSTALHTRISEDAAARLLRAFRSRNQKAIRAAIAPYAAQWKALDARTRAKLASQVGLTQDSVLAEFGSFNSESVAANVMSAQFPPQGSCAILPESYPFELGSNTSGLDAGQSLAMTGAAGSVTLNRVATGRYQGSFGNSAAGTTVPLGSYTISGSGGKNIGAFSDSVSVAAHLSISNKLALASVTLQQPLTVTWTGGSSGSYVLLGGGSTQFPHSYFVCAEDAGKGTFTVPAYIISAVGVTAPGEGVVWIAPNPLSNQIAIPGVDFAYFIDGSYDSVNVTFANSGGPPTSNATNVSGSIDGLYPASGAIAAQYGGMSTSGPLSFSALLAAATFNVSFDIPSGASPFQVKAVSAGGSAVVSINPAQGTWQATYTVPTAAARTGNFAGSGITVLNFLANGVPFPGNIVPLTFLDPIAVQATAPLPLPNSTVSSGGNSSWSSSGALPAGGHFTIGSGGVLGGAFGGFINLSTRGPQSTSFSLSVDGTTIASKQVSFTTD